MTRRVGSCSVRCVRARACVCCEFGCGGGSCGGFGRPGSASDSALLILPPLDCIYAHTPSPATLGVRTLSARIAHAVTYHALSVLCLICLIISADQHLEHLTPCNSTDYG